MQLSPITIESTSIISQNEPESDTTKLQQSTDINRYKSEVSGHGNFIKLFG
jgi:hypothetical protein